MFNVFGNSKEIDDHIKLIDCVKNEGKKLFVKTDLDKLYDEYCEFFDHMIKDLKNCHKAKIYRKSRCIEDADGEYIVVTSSFHKLLMDNVSSLLFSLIFSSLS